MNRLVRRLTRVGISVRGARELRVRGRSSGEARSAGQPVEDRSRALPGGGETQGPQPAGHRWRGTAGRPVHRSVHPPARWPTPTRSRSCARLPEALGVRGGGRSSTGSTATLRRRNWRVHRSEPPRVPPLARYTAKPYPCMSWVALLPRGAGSKATQCDRGWLWRGPTVTGVGPPTSAPIGADAPGHRGRP